MTEQEKLLAGEPYYSSDPQLRAKSNHAKKLTKEYNNMPAEDLEGRDRVLHELLEKCGENVRINQPFYVDYGCNISMGDNSFANINCTFLDTHKIAIGDYTLVGPDVKIYTAHHSMDARERYDRKEDGTLVLKTIASPVTIGSHVWIGGGSIILPGVTIGSNVIIGAGSVVTKSIPDNVTAVGNPCRVIRKNEKFS